MTRIEQAIANRPSEYDGLHELGIQEFERRWDTLVMHCTRPDVPHLADGDISTAFTEQSEIDAADDVTDLDLLRLAAVHNYTTSGGLYPGQLLSRMMLLEFWPDSLGNAFDTRITMNSAQRLEATPTPMFDVKYFYEDKGAPVDKEYIARVLQWGLDSSVGEDRDMYRRKVGLKADQLTHTERGSALAFGELPAEERVDMTQLLLSGQMAYNVTGILGGQHGHSVSRIDELDVAIIERGIRGCERQFQNGSKFALMASKQVLSAVRKFIAQDADELFASDRTEQEFRRVMDSYYSIIAAAQQNVRPNKNKLENRFLSDPVSFAAEALFLGDDHVYVQSTLDRVIDMYIRSPHDVRAGATLIRLAGNSHTHRAELGQAYNEAMKGELTRMNTQAAEEQKQRQRVHGALDAFNL